MIGGAKPGVCGSCYERGEGEPGVGAVSAVKSGNMLGSKLCGTASDGEQRSMARGVVGMCGNRKEILGVHNR